MRWNTIPTKLQRELFDCAHTAFDSRQTLKGQIARFLHDHKDDEQLVGVSNRTGKFPGGKGADIDLSFARSRSRFDDVVVRTVAFLNRANIV
jgi:hypothetical protein